MGRPAILNSGGTGEEISREDNWVENSIERRFKMYFEGTSTEWNLYEARVYDNTQPPDWLLALIDGTEVGVRTANTLFHCDYFEVNYDCLGESNACNSAKFMAHDVFVGAYLTSSYDPCAMNIYRPYGNEKASSVVDGIISCSNSMSTGPSDYDSRGCSKKINKFSCPDLMEPCMNEQNTEECLDLVAQGCEDILTLESCPLHFVCNDITPNPTIVPIITPCPAVTEPCMNSDNYAQCMDLVEAGCQEIWKAKSCPLQFECGDIVDDTSNNPAIPCPNITEPCMNKDNLAVCITLYEDGCENIMILESCPVQFSCGDSTATDTPNQTAVPIIAACPAATEPCMNKENYAKCMDLLEGGCLDIMIRESCPLQFDCGDATEDFSQLPKMACPNVTVPCMNSDNLAVCMSLHEGGCENIMILESCPLQFQCNDRTKPSTDNAYNPVDFTCPDITEQCMNENNYASCMDLHASGCDVKVAPESCPLQFFCGDDDELSSMSPSQVRSSPSSKYYESISGTCLDRISIYAALIILLAAPWF